MCSDRRRASRRGQRRRQPLQVGRTAGGDQVDDDRRADDPVGHHGEAPNRHVVDAVRLQRTEDPLRRELAQRDRAPEAAGEVGQPEPVTQALLHRLASGALAHMRVALPAAADRGRPGERHGIAMLKVEDRQEPMMTAHRSVRMRAVSFAHEPALEGRGRLTEK